jgi:serine protease
MAFACFASGIANLATKPQRRYHADGPFGSNSFAGFPTKRKGAAMNLRRTVLLLAALLLSAVLVLPAGASVSPVSDPGLPEAAAGSGPFQGAIPVTQIILKDRTSAALGGAAVPVRAAEMQRLSEAAGVPLTYRRAMSGDAHVLGLPAPTPLEDAAIIAARLSALPEVEYAEPDAYLQPAYEPDDPRYGSQWNLFAPGGNHYGIDAPAAWELTTGSASVVVADIDTGITNHVEFSGSTVPGYDFITDSQVANDGDGRDSDPSDPGDWITSAESSSGYFRYCAVTNSSWHGTHTAGLIGATGNNAVGVAGANWSSKILPVRVLGKCGGVTSDIVDAMRWSAGLPVPGVPDNPNPAQVLNLSLGGVGSCGSAEQDAIDDIIAEGATVVIAAGNSNANAGNFRPGNCSGVITVAATNRNGSRAFYSNYGAVVEISAPGGETNITSSNGVLSTLNTGTKGPVADTYVYYQGTSMATPQVAGVVSLLYALKPSLTPAEALAILQSTVTPFPSGSSCSTTDCGSGIVNAGAAAAAIQPFEPTEFMWVPLVVGE